MQSNTNDSASQTPSPKGKEQRKIKNLLIDSKFQLRYALFGGLVTFLLCALLCLIVLMQTRSARSSIAEQRERATELLRKQRAETTSLVEKMRENTLKDLAKVLDTATQMVAIHTKSKEKAVRDAALEAKKELQKADKARLERERKATKELVAQRKAADNKMVSTLQTADKKWLKSYTGQQQLLISIVIFFGIAVVVLIFFFNIRFTHKAAGPLFKIRRYIDNVRNGHFGHIGTLRKGDQLVDFHERFRGMHDYLREQVEVDIESIERVLAFAQRNGLDDPSLEVLRKRLAAKRASLQSNDIT